MDIERKHFWIPLALAFMYFIMLSTTPFDLFYHFIAIVAIISHVWLAIFIGAPRLLSRNN